METNGQRMCHIIKRPDFDGYGFNLHSEKGKPGQFIGKVDEQSPAEESGLRQGDRIIEVNGVKIGSETHKQVVQRIKAIANEVRLLVIDPEIEMAAPPSIAPESPKLTPTTPNGNDINKTPTPTTPNSPKTLELATQATLNNNLGEDMVDSEKTLEDEHPKIYESKSNGIHLSRSGPNSPTMPMPVKIPTVPSLATETISNGMTTPTTPAPPSVTFQKQQQKISVSSSSSSASTATPSSSEVAPVSQTTTNPTPVKEMSDMTLTATTTTTLTDNGNLATINKKPTSSSSGGLNFNMTAAEMRAKLQARKKYDPKNDAVDLRKKFDIIQKL